MSSGATTIGDSALTGNYGVARTVTVRLPAAVVQALDLKEGDDIELHVAGERSLEVARKTPPQELLSRLRRLRGRLPADFRFDRLETDDADRAR